MNVDIDIYLLMNNKVTASQYVILYLIHKKQFELLNSYLISNDFKTFEVDIEDLISKQYITRFEYFTPLDIRGYKVTTAGAQIVSTSAIDFFDEFLQEYPDKVISNGIVRYLKSDLTKCRVKYNRLVKGKTHLHEHILECLRFEIKIRERSGGMMYFKKLSNWLETEEWKAYENDMRTNVESKPQQQYGTSLE